MAAALSLVSLAACQNNPEKPIASSDQISAKNSAVMESDPAMLQLVSIAQNIHARAAINDQIMTSRYKIEDEQRIPLQYLPTDMKRIISFPGGTQLPLDTALKKISQLGNVGYIQPQGKTPISGIYVIFDGQLRTVAEYLADAARQAGYRADVVFDITAEPRPTVQIIYKGAVL